MEQQELTITCEYKHSCKSAGDSPNCYDNKQSDCYQYKEWTKREKDKSFFRKNIERLIEEDKYP